MAVHDDRIRIMTVGGRTPPITVGIDIGTTSVKALAVSEKGEVLARARVPHRVIHTSADHMEHDARAAWRRGPRRALRAIRQTMRGAGTIAGAPEGGGPAPLAGICVAGMVPSLTAVDRRGIPRTPGLLYGDIRGRAPETPVPDTGAGAMRDAEGFLRWTAQERPDAYGYWPAQAVATHALTGHATIDTAVTASLGDLQRAGRWNDELMASLGVQPSQLPAVVLTGQPAGGLHQVGGTSTRPSLSVPEGTEAWDGGEAVVAGGTIDAFCDQIVAGADDVGDVLAIFGATLVVWVVTDTWVEVPGLWTVPHTTPGRVLVGGPSNAGALFVDWARSLLRAERAGRAAGHAHESRSGDPRRVPVWLPYLRGERVPYHDVSLRACLFDLDITDGPSGIARAAFEASGFVIRSIAERSGVSARRIVASGGGTQLVGWMQGVADATGLPVDTVAVPEGAALGAAFLARMAAGLEPSLDGSRRWARRGTRVDPDLAWQAAAEGRYERFIGLGSGR